jgi:hypothetical protein
VDRNLTYKKVECVKTPIALFVYNRLELTKKTLEALQQTHGAIESDLFIFCDGAKASENEMSQIKIAEVRNFVKSINSFKSIHIIEQTTNLGLIRSILNGLSYVLEKFNSVIVLEDDIVVGKDFLHFMNNALVKYENEPQIAGISGYSFPLNEKQPYFSRTGSCWGWATYKRVWEQFIKEIDDIDISKLPPNELKLFNVYDTFYQTMFEQNKAGLIQSWAILFYLHYFLNKQYFLFSGVNLVDNTGFDGSGAHQTNSNFLTNNNPILKCQNIEFPDQIFEKEEIRKKITQLYRNGLSKPSWFKSFFLKTTTYIVNRLN